MTLEHVLLLGLILVPLLAGIACACLGAARRDAIRWLAVGASLLTLVMSLVLAARFMELPREDVKTGIVGKRAAFQTFQPEFVPGAPAIYKSRGVAELDRTDPHGTTWDLIPLGKGAIQFYIGIDGLNIWLIVLTAVLMLPTVLISWNAISERANEFYAWLLALKAAMIGIFLSFDIVLFYVFFELSLVPLFFLIGIWGGSERRYAARKFFIYTLVGSLITLLGVLAIVFLNYRETGVLTFSIPRLVDSIQAAVATPNSIWTTELQTWVFLALMLGFMIKVPLMPFHTWLPLAHVEAPTAGSVDLAGVLLKVGSYGFLRLCIPLVPDAAVTVGVPLITFIAALGIVYGALCAFAQDDMKRMIAYSSVSHLGLCMLGMFALNSAGIGGSLLQMINHGLSTGMLFLMIGMLYDRYHTRKIADYSGMSARLPLIGAFFVFTVLTSVGLPGLNGFVGEALCLFGVFKWELDAGGQHAGFPILALMGCAGIILGAWYLFTLTRAILFGPVKEPHHDEHEPTRDLTGREVAIIVPLAVLCLILGVYPQPVLETATPDINRVVDIAERARERGEATTTAGLAP
ncbi:MAG: NADH-quinone oxidoreductase subunit M [Gemmataceae bacterium]